MSVYDDLRIIYTAISPIIDGEISLSEINILQREIERLSNNCKLPPFLIHGIYYNTICRTYNKLCYLQSDYKSNDFRDVVCKLHTIIIDLAAKLNIDAKK